MSLTPRRTPLVCVRLTLYALILLLSVLLTACVSPNEESSPPPSGCWAEVAVPDLGEGTVILNGIHAFSERDVWAVGQRTLPGGEHIVTVAMRWDGTAWKHMTAPDGPAAPNAKSHLYAVGGTGGEDLWAVGAVAEDGVHYTGLALHWNGTKWREYE